MTICYSIGVDDGDAQRGAVYGAKLSNVVARIPDLRNATLDVRGVAEGPLADMVRYVNTSPFRAGSEVRRRTLSKRQRKAGSTAHIR